MTAPTYPPSPYPPMPPPQGRPATVTIASALLFVVAVAQVVFGILAFSALSKAGDVYDVAYSGTEFANLGSTVVAFAVVLVVLYLIIGIGLGLLGFFDLRGKQPARVITWIVSGLLMCCAVIVPQTAVVLITDFASAISGNATGTSRLPTQRELDALLDGSVPGWFDSLGVWFTLFALPALIAVVILLAVPPSNRFFRKPAAGWNPYQQPGYPGGYVPSGYGQPYPGAYPPPGAVPGGQPGPGQPG
ncbi:hypothetical protein, partial [Actinoplanes cyaneus]